MSCIITINRFGVKYLTTRPLSNITWLETLILPPTATVRLSRLNGITISRRESYCKIESASNDVINGYLAKLIPIFKASAFPPFTLLTRVNLIFSLMIPS